MVGARSTNASRGRPRSWSVTVVVVLLLALGGCGTDDGDTGTDDTIEETDTEQATTDEPSTDEDATEDTDGATEDTTEDTTEEDGAAAGLVIVDFAFEPDTLEVAAGTTIEVLNEDGATHTVTADDGSFDVRLAGGQTLSFQVEEPGTFPYACAIHPAMTGTLVVG
jgi:plastocyanin